MNVLRSNKMQSSNRETSDKIVCQYATNCGEFLKLVLPTYPGDSGKGVANYNDMVKRHKILQWTIRSDASLVTKMNVQRLSNGSYYIAIGSKCMIRC